MSEDMDKLNGDVKALKDGQENLKLADSKADGEIQKVKDGQ